MPAPATIDEFLDLVPKSGVVEAKRLDAYLKPLRAASALPQAPRQMADLLVRDGLLTQFQVQQLLLGKYLGFTLGNYRVLELLGSGGMSAVYLCEHREERRRVAVKVLPKSLAKDETLLKRFYREARASAALDHANIVRGFEVAEEKGQHFLVMEFVDGTSLQAVVKKSGPMSPLRAAHYIRQAALGLQHAHEAKVVHRDIKPANLLVDRGGTVKILDMGLSRFSGGDEDSVLTKDVLGTIDYLAPEQARDSHAVDIRADIYSLGGAFYFLLTGQTPLDKMALDPRLLAKGHTPRSVRLLRPEVPEALAAILSKMMAAAPEHRFQTPMEVANALDPWTRIAIPPPTDVEIPQLSPAARRAGAGDVISVGGTGPASSERGLRGLIARLLRR
ncbi:MAG: serine/threonine protein kinase [Gemmataceae bacterium]|nr:serine/threonine protein kinase [Gemmataceae bacterium]